MRAPRPMARLLAPEHRVLALALVVVAAVWLFAFLAFAVLHGDSRALDEAALRALRDPRAPDHLRGPAWLASTARDVTALGSHAVLVPLLLASAGFLLLLRKNVMALAVLASGGGAMVLERALKDHFLRPRPLIVPRLVPAWNPSFPSGHALLSSAIYLSIAVLVVRLVPYRRVRLYVLALAALLVGLIGFSRVLLGVHYPTDVVAGWIVGGLWALLCGIGARALQRVGAAEPAGLPAEVKDESADASAPPASAGDRLASRGPTSDPSASLGPAAPRR